MPDKVYVLLYHDIWSVSYADAEGGPKDVTIEGVYTTLEAAEAAKTTEPLTNDYGVANFYEIEEQELHA